MLKYLLNGFSQNSCSPAVYDPYARKAAFDTLIEVLGDEGLHIAGPEGVKVELVGELPLFGTVLIALVISPIANRIHVG